MMLEIHILAWDRHKNVAGLNWSMHVLFFLLLFNHQLIKQMDCLLSFHRLHLHLMFHPHFHLYRLQIHCLLHLLFDVDT